MQYVEIARQEISVVEVNEQIENRVGFYSKMVRQIIKLAWPMA